MKAMLQPPNLTPKNGPYTPAPIVVDLLRPMIDLQGMEATARECRITARMLQRWVYGEAQWVSFPVLDRIVTYGLDDPSILSTIPGLEYP